MSNCGHCCIVISVVIDNAVLCKRDGCLHRSRDHRLVVSRVSGFTTKVSALDNRSTSLFIAISIGRLFASNLGLETVSLLVSPATITATTKILLCKLESDEFRG